MTQSAAKYPFTRTSLVKAFRCESCECARGASNHPREGSPCGSGRAHRVEALERRGESAVLRGFYAARALLATHNLDSARHSGIISLFQEHFVRSGLIAGEVARVLPRAFEKRQTSDYDDFMEPSEDEVSSLRSQIERFV